MISRKKARPAKSPSAPVLMETLESRTLLDATVPVATWFQGSTYVFAMDMADTGLTQAELLADVTVKFNKDNSVASITLKGKDSLTGLGLYVTGASKVGTISDQRTAASKLRFDSFADVNANTGVIQFKSPTHLATGDPVVYSKAASKGSEDMTGLVSGQTYYAIAVDPYSIRLADTLDDARQGIGIALTKLSLKDPKTGLETGVGEIQTLQPSTVPGDLAFIASAAPVTSLTLKSGLSGSNLNGWGDLGGLGAALPADIDGDGVTTDLTSLYIADGNSGKVDVKGQLGGDVFVSGNLTTLTNRSEANVTTRRVTPIDIDVLGQGVQPKTPPQITMNFNVLDQVNITSNLPIKSFTARAVRAVGDDTGARQMLTAPYIGTIKVTGGRSSAGAAILGVFAEDVTLNEASAKGVSLASITTKGAIESAFTAPGRVAAINVGGWFGGSVAAGSVGALTSAGNWAVDVTATGNIDKVTVKGELGGQGGAPGSAIYAHWSANAIPTMSVGVALHAVVFDLTQPYSPALQSMGKLTVKLGMYQVAINSAGNLGDITTGDLQYTTIFAGVTDPQDFNGVSGPDGVYDLPALSQLTAGVSIKSLKIVPGWDPNPNTPPPGFYGAILNANVAADHLGKMTLGDIGYVNSGIPFGLAFNTYTSITETAYVPASATRLKKSITYTYGGTNWVPQPEDFRPA